MDDDFDESKPRKRGRPKGSKNTPGGGGGAAARKYQKRVKTEAMIAVKEEAIDKTFDEFNGMFLQKVRSLVFLVLLRISSKHSQKVPL